MLHQMLGSGRRRHSESIHRGHAAVAVCRADSHGVRRRVLLVQSDQVCVVDDLGGNRCPMTATRVFHLTNPAAGQDFDLTVAEGSDVLAAAQAHLEESGLYGDLQQSFYISVYPRSPEGDAPPTTQSTPADPAATAADTEEEAILA